MTKLIYSVFCIPAVFFLLNFGCAVVKNTPDTGSAVNRPEILLHMQEVMGPLPSFKNLPPFDVKFIDSVKGNNNTRYNIRFTVAPGEDVSALLYLPADKNLKLKAPAMLVLHGTDALGKMVLSGTSPKPNRAYAVELAERGYVVLAPDYPGFGDAKDYNFETDRYVSGTMKGIFNHLRCVDLLQSLPEVDGSKVGVLGHSLGGHNAIFAAAFDERLKVTVSSCGWTLFDFYDAGENVTKLHGGKLGPWAQERYMPFIKTKYRLDPAAVPFDFDEVISIIAPRAFFTNSPLGDANFNADGVKKGMEYIDEVYQKFGAINNVRAVYPDAGHDFPKSIRLEAYRFVDSVFHHTPNQHQLHR